MGDGTGGGTMMRGYIVTRGGLFGAVERSYVGANDAPCVVICWGPLCWLAPALESDCHQLTSRFEIEARAEAEEWLKTQPSVDGGIVHSPER